MEKLTSGKKILVLSSNGGYGHSAAVSTLQKILGTRYEMCIIYPINDVHICGIFSRENIYNQMLLKGWVRSTNILARIFAPLFFRIRHKLVEELITKAIEKEKPDLVLSIIPFLNFPAAEATHKKGLPFLLVTTDNDLKNWVIGLKSMSRSHFKVTIGNELPTTRQMLMKYGVDQSAIQNLGLPLRLEFIQKRSKEQLRTLYQVAEDRHVVLLMMGGAGANCAFDLAKSILKLPLSVHLIVCTGKNEQLINRLKNIFPHPSNALMSVGFTQDIPDLMALADLLITKPGPGTINEAIAMQLPILIDDTKKALYWERINIDLILKYGIGAQIKRYQDIQSLLQKYLKNPKVRTEIQEAYAKIPPCTFHEKIEPLIEEMLDTKHT